MEVHKLKTELTVRRVCVVHVRIEPVLKERSRRLPEFKLTRRVDGRSRCLDGESAYKRGRP